MKPILFGLALALGAMCLSSCSKGKPEPQSASSSITVTTPDGVFSLGDVDKALKEKDYDTAVKILGQFKVREAVLEPDQRNAIEQKIRETINALLEVKYQDPKAAAAYDLLGKIVVGR